MTSLDDEFDIDLRLSVDSHQQSGVGRFGGAFPRAQTEEETAQNQTCAADTCDLGCQTQTCPEETCGCNTAETCDQALEDCGGGFTFGPYCEDASGGEDSCDGCAPAGTDLCADPPDE